MTPDASRTIDPGVRLINLKRSRAFDIVELIPNGRSQPRAALYFDMIV
jgi:hypothetical protein